MSAVAFTICFAIWMMFAVTGIPLKTSLGLDETRRGIRHPATSLQASPA
ncbi:MAG TPA: hypothetical protein VFV71_00730 [Burkholderiales bacterium]|nr:hypothetical protein [Burkholderiales bacterium]